MASWNSIPEYLRPGLVRFEGGVETWVEPRTITKLDVVGWRPPNPESLIGGVAICLLWRDEGTKYRYPFLWFTRDEYDARLDGVKHGEFDSVAESMKPGQYWPRADSKDFSRPPLLMTYDEVQLDFEKTKSGEYDNPPTGIDAPWQLSGYWMRQPCVAGDGTQGLGPSIGMEDAGDSVVITDRDEDGRLIMWIG